MLTAHAAKTCTVGPSADLVRARVRVRVTVRVWVSVRVRVTWTVGAGADHCGELASRGSSRTRLSSCTG